MLREQLEGLAWQRRRKAILREALRTAAPEILGELRRAWLDEEPVDDGAVELLHQHEARALRHVGCATQVARLLLQPQVRVALDGARPLRELLLARGQHKAERERGQVSRCTFGVRVRAVAVAVAAVCFAVGCGRG